MELANFIVKAKKDTYASGNPPLKLPDGFEEFVYEDGEYKYRDRYHAKDPRPFGGEEVVWQSGKVIWMMNYYGYMISNEVNSKEVYVFLRKAMSAVSKDKPFRGPAHLKEGDFQYINESSGDVNQFKGTEKILHKGM